MEGMVHYACLSTAAGKLMSVLQIKDSTSSISRAIRYYILETGKHLDPFNGFAPISITTINYA
jgi:hypothetical protein